MKPNSREIGVILDKVSEVDLLDSVLRDHRNATDATNGSGLDAETVSALDEAIRAGGCPPNVAVELDGELVYTSIIMLAYSSLHHKDPLVSQQNGDLAAGLILTLKQSHVFQPLEAQFES